MAGRQLEIPEVGGTHRQAPGRAAARLPQQDRPAVRRGHQAHAEFKPEFDFGQAKTEGNGAAAEVDFTGQEPVGKCPQCGGRVFETAMHYICENATGNAPTCKFRVGQDHPSASGRARANAEAAPDRQDRSAAAVHLQEGPAVQGLPGGQGWRRRLRVRAARGQGEKRRRPQGARSAGAEIRLHRPEAGRQVSQVPQARIRGGRRLTFARDHSPTRSPASSRSTRLFSSSRSIAPRQPGCSTTA